MTTRRKIIAAFRLEGATGRKLLTGVFGHINSKSDWSIRVINSPNELLQAIQRDESDGYLVDTMASGEIIDALKRINRPTVFVNVTKDLVPHGRRFASVRNDDGGVGIRAANYLNSLGKFRSYGFVPADGNPTWSERRGQAFRLQLARHGRSCEIYTPTSKNSDSDHDSLVLWIRQLPKPTALMCAFDHCAACVSEACLTAKVNIPEQVVILGVDDDEFFCFHARPPLSSIDLGAKEQGCRAAETLDAILRGRKHKTESIVRLHRLIERESTRPIAPAAALIQRAMDFIRANVTDNITPETVARALNVSRRLVDLRLRESGEGTLATLITDMRLSLLADTLKKSNLPAVKLIAQVGFKNCNHARDLFRYHYGMTIGEWRKQV